MGKASTAVLLLMTVLVTGCEMPQDRFNGTVVKSITLLHDQVIALREDVYKLQHDIHVLNERTLRQTGQPPEIALLQVQVAELMKKLK